MPSGSHTVWHERRHDWRGIVARVLKFDADAARIVQRHVATGSRIERTRAALLKPLVPPPPVGPTPMSRVLVGGDSEVDAHRRTCCPAYAFCLDLAALGDWLSLSCRWCAWQGDRRAAAEWCRREERGGEVACARADLARACANTPSPRLGAQAVEQGAKKPSLFAGLGRQTKK